LERPLIFLYASKRRRTASKNEILRLVPSSRMPYKRCAVTDAPRVSLGFSPSFPVGAGRVLRCYKPLPHECSLKALAPPTERRQIGHARVHMNACPGTRADPLHERPTAGRDPQALCLSRMAIRASRPAAPTGDTVVREVKSSSQGSVLSVMVGTTTTDSRSTPILTAAGYRRLNASNGQRRINPRGCLLIRVGSQLGANRGAPPLPAVPRSEPPLCSHRWGRQ
jgi:hypothetical protein